MSNSSTQRSSALGRAFSAWWLALGEARVDRRAVSLLAQRVKFRLTSDAFSAWAEIAFFGKRPTVRCAPSNGVDSPPVDGSKRPIDDR